MEALLLIFAEIVFACLAPLLGLIGALVGALLEFLALLLGGGFAALAEHRKRGREAKGEVPRAPRKPLVSRKTLHWVAGTLGVFGVLGILATFVLFQPILRTVMQTAGERAGVEISFEAASGTLLLGKVALDDVSLKREDAEGLGFDLKVARAEADVDLWSLLGSEPRIDLAAAHGITGQISPPKPDKDKPKLRKERRPFRAEMVRVSGVEIEVRPKGSAPYMLEITEAAVAPFRSQLALFDLLFRSNMEAKIAGQALSVSTRKVTENGRETYWRFEEVDAAQLGLVVPKAPLTWLDAGRVSVRVDDRWSLSEDWIEMDWDVSAQDLEVSLPASAAAGEKMLGNAFAKLVQAKGGTANFQYALRLNKDDIDALRQGDISQFWDLVLSGFVGSKVKATQGGADRETEAEPGKVKRAVERMKGLFGKGNEE